MKHLKKNIINFNETVIEDSFGKRILLNEFRVPRGYNAIDFDLIISIRDPYATEKIFSASLQKTENSNIADLTNTPGIVVPASKLLTIKINKPSATMEKKLKMIILYQHA
jgi:hypothetical protein